MVIPADLGTGEPNIKLHRAHVLGKMGVKSLADLVRAAGVNPENPSTETARLLALELYRGR